MDLVPLQTVSTVDAAALGPGALARVPLAEPPAFLPDGTRFAVGDRTGHLAVCERCGTEPDAPFRRVAGVHVPPAGAYSHPEVRAVAWSPPGPGGPVLAVHEYRGVCVRDADDLSERAFAPHVGSGPIAAGGGGGWLAVLSDASASILSLPGLERRGSHYIANRGGYEYFRTVALAADPDGTLVAVGDDGGSDETAMGMITGSGTPRVTLIDAQAGEVVGEINGEHAQRLAFDPWRDRLLVATFGDVGVFRPDGAPVRRFRPYSGGLGSYVRAFALTERLLVTTAAYAGPAAHAALDLWHPGTLAPLGLVPVPEGTAPDWIVASPDGRTLLTPGRVADSGHWGVRVWRVQE